jgi:hypothetical protein
MPVRVVSMSMSMADNRFEKLLKNIALIKSRNGMDIAEFQKMIADKVEAREMDIEDIMILLAWIDFEGEKVTISKEAERKLEELVKLARKTT